MSVGIVVVTAGHACSYKILPDWGCEILDFIFPGDQTELYNVPLQSTDHGIFALDPTAIVWINHDQFISELTGHPRVAAAFERSVHQRVAILRERITSLGRRDAYARVAHLPCEMFERLSLVGEAVDYTYRLPGASGTGRHARSLRGARQSHVEALGEGKADRLGGWTFENTGPPCS